MAPKQHLDASFISTVKSLIFKYLNTRNHIRFGSKVYSPALFLFFIFLLNPSVCKFTLLMPELVLPPLLPSAKVSAFCEGLIQSPLLLPAAVLGQRRQGMGGKSGVGRRMREAASADRERGNSDMTMTNCLVFIQIV